MMRKPVFSVLLLVIAASTEAALIDRGGGFIYDDVLDITWAQNASLSGLGTWSTQMAWVDSLSIYDSVRDVTWDDWRLPTATQPDPSCSRQYNAGPSMPIQGSDYGCTGSEMGHLSNVDGISVSTPGLFINLASDRYWTSQEIQLFSLPPAAYTYRFTDGFQGSLQQEGFSLYAWAVRDGDVATSAVPIPSALGLFISATGLIGWLSRRGT